MQVALNCIAFNYLPFSVKKGGRVVGPKPRRRPAAVEKLARRGSWLFGLSKSEKAKALKAEQDERDRQEAAAAARAAEEGHAGAAAAAHEGDADDILAANR